VKIIRDLGAGTAGVPPARVARYRDQVSNCSLSNVMEVTNLDALDAGRRGRLRSQHRGL